MDKTSIIIYGITILEPVTLLTDFITAFLSLFFSIKLLRTGLAGYKSSWFVFFIAFGISTMVAGVAHGFYLYFGKVFLMFSWTFGAISIFPLTNATIILIKNKHFRKLLQYLLLLIIISSFVLIYYYKNFLVVTFMTAVCVMGIKFPTLIYYNRKCHENYYKFILLGIGISAFSAIIHGFKISISPWFNHKDISHVILSISLLFFYYGAKNELHCKKNSVLHIKKSK